jgi:hypothetical protein
MKKSEGKFHGKNKYLYNDDLDPFWRWLIIFTYRNPCYSIVPLSFMIYSWGKRAKKKGALTLARSNQRPWKQKDETTRVTSTAERVDH